ncbi:ribokinase [Litoreibacter ponti]|uniref:Ribokinase n=1 Tax=Litoreibacter ponti TaxID=1510457 RepID=A0A2T6BEL0_9RHOB|nr:PfkB family carbohydrate kinase [Litoreibacter ponti]PTX54495.1 ribokinase [Litoreibacter ponti]
MIDVFVAGSLHWDVVVDAPRLPRLDETLMGRSVDYRFGGKGGNQAVAAARMGASVAMAGRIGRDAFGQQLRFALAAAGVDHAQVLECDDASGMSVAIVDAAGDYGAVVVSAANTALNPDDIRLPDGLKVMLLQNEVPEAVNLALAKRAGDDTRVLLNAAPARALPAALLARVDVLITNRIEAAALTGADRDALEPEAAAKQLCAMGPQSAIVTLGADGLVCADASGVTTLAACRVDTASSHGAGDMFCGALASELARGASLAKAAEFGNAAAALAVSMDVHARVELTPDAVRRFMATADKPH